MAETDTTARKLAAMPEDTVKGNRLYQLSQQYTTENPAQSILYAQQLLTLARKINHPVLEMKALNGQGMAYGFVGSYTLAADNFYEVLRLRKEAGDMKAVATALTNIGVLHARQNQFRQALGFYRRADSIMEAFPGSVESRAVIRSNISDMYNRLLLPDSAILYVRKILAVDSLIRNPSTRLLPYLREAKSRFLKQEYAEALAKYRYVEAQLGAAIGNASGNTLYRGISEVYLGKKDYPEALRNALKACDFAQKSGSQAERQMALEHLALVHTRMGNYKDALACTQEVNALKEALNSRQVMLHLQTLETHFDLTSKARENARLQKANRLQAGLILTALIILTLTGILLLVLYRVNYQRRRALQEISTINRSLEHVVEERTRELTQRNAQLISYAYLNSHHIRGPLARLMGLVYLLRQGWWGSSTEELVELIDISAMELDTVIREINNSLHKAETEKQPLP